MMEFTIFISIVVLSFLFIIFNERRVKKGKIPFFLKELKSK